MMGAGGHWDTKKGEIGQPLPLSSQKTMIQMQFIVSVIKFSIGTVFPSCSTDSLSSPLAICQVCEDA
ncbi:hypothetical protein E2C01_098741 [Portunus trituberculatus]|uniref:Uncharacterized protein n=1 Tax=Portunus trituberculatus TaxID=210409 RepID=A0A5B7K7Q8_PORTR|nr:hypothetical protein [Portunus trituberculatus]